MQQNIYIQLFLSFFKIGAFTIGGGIAMIPLIEKEVVDKKKWIDKEYFIDMLALAQTVPGIMAVNTSIFVGYKLKGIRGALTAVLGTVLPSFVIILLIAIFYIDVKDNPVVERIFKGIRPAVVALIVVPLWGMAKSARLNVVTVFVLIAVALLVWQVGFSPIYIIMGVILIGILFHLINSRQLKK